jgi:hypothetical protein
VQSVKETAEDAASTVADEGRSAAGQDAAGTVKEQAQQ